LLDVGDFLIEQSCKIWIVVQTAHQIAVNHKKAEKTGVRGEGDRFGFAIATVETAPKNYFAGSKQLCKRAFSRPSRNKLRKSNRKDKLQQRRGRTGALSPSRDSRVALPAAVKDLHGSPNRPP
jgi:hypothetical protein